MKDSLRYFPDSITEKKKKGNSLSQSEIEFIVNGYTAGIISDNEMTYWLKAVFEHGMIQQETLQYTHSMLNSGVKLNFSHLTGYVIDKHSTGGVGDKISLILGPLLAACGCYVPMLSGRGLEHTQGTIDKLETIPGYSTSLSLDKFKRIVQNVGISIICQTDQICPADRKIYALRDVSNTVASFPLICGSIMSKKIAAGIEALVLDIKIGNGAFIKTISQAKELGELLKNVGKSYNIHVAISITDMNQPLGKTAGLWCEVIESIECLQGKGPTDVMALVYHLGIKALEILGLSNPSVRLKTAINDGSAMDKFRQMIEAHGGALDSLSDPNTNKPKYREKLYAETEGFITEMDTLKIGKAIVLLGGGRITKHDVLDPTVGITFYKKLGEVVHVEEPLLEYYCSDKNKFENSQLYFKDAIQIKAELPPSSELIYS